MSKAIVFRNHQNEKIYPCPYYPVGSVYISLSSTDPSTYFGGTWERIKGRFLLSADDNTYKVNATGGEANVTLTVNHIPAHSHSAWLNNAGGHNHVFWFGGGANSGTGAQIPVANSRWGQDVAGQTDGSHDHGGISIANTGGNQAHNNMPPYFVVYMWRRVS